jgi:hypothetical protein
MLMEFFVGNYLTWFEVPENFLSEISFVQSVGCVPCFGRH